MNHFAKILDTIPHSVIRLEAGERVRRGDEPGDCIYVVVRGEVEIWQRSELFSSRVATLGCGEFFTADATERSILRAGGPCLAARIYPEDFHDFSTAVIELMVGLHERKRSLRRASFAAPGGAR